MIQVPIETGATIGDLLDLLDSAVALHGRDAKVRGSVVVWADDEPVLVIGMAPEYESEIER